MTAPAFGQAAPEPPTDIIAYLNADVAAADGQRSWLQGGLGKTRFHGDADGDVRAEPYVSEGGLVLQPQLGWAFGATVSMIGQQGQRNPLDLSEAFLTFHPLPIGGVRIQLRAGLFWPPVSLEHTAGEWAVRDGITPSAINSWIGEEVKVLGTEASLSTSLGSHRLTATGALFDDNDTAGTLLTFRGWALGDIKATAFGRYDLPPRNPFMTAVQANFTAPLLQLGDRKGYYAKLAWRPPWPFELSYFRYDNRVNPELVNADRQWGWRTRFDQLGLIVDPGASTRLTVQAMRGTTRMGFAIADVRWVDMRFRSAFLLATRKMGRGTLSARVEGFDTRNRGSREFAFDDEHGWAATLGAMRRIRPGVTVLAEAQHIDSHREASSDSGSIRIRRRLCYASRCDCAGAINDERTEAETTAMRVLAVLIGLCAAGVAAAADLDVQVRDAAGKPVPEAVVALYPVDRPAPAPRAGGAYAVDQQNIQFHPFVLIVPAGARVAFLNHDPVRHHVYSFSPAKRFELKLEERQSDRSVVFDKPGIVPLGCNIHDKMIAFIDIVDTAWAIKTGADGHAAFHGLPAAGMRIVVWHPYLKAPANRLERTVPLADAAPRREAFGVQLRSPPKPPAIADY